MTAPSDPKDAAQPVDEEQEITLRLGDILPRVPAHLLKPGPHDTTPEIRFSVEELAEKISRGRVSVPLKRLSSVCPTVFRDSSAFPGEQEVPLPLQKLLEQVGLIVPKPAAANGIPGDQISQARVQAARIIENKWSTPSSQPVQQPPDSPPNQPPPTPPDAPNPISKAISTARHLLGLLRLQSDAPAPAEKTTGIAFADSQKAPPPPTETPTPVQSAPQVPPSAPAPPEPVAPATPEGCISVHLLPILRLLSPPVLKSTILPADDASVTLPLSAIDPQLPGGHVEISVEEFVKGLPENFRDLIDPIPGNQIWIPLDEIFQNLPTHHLFYMPPFDPLAQPIAVPVEESLPAEPAPEAKEAAPVVTESEKAAEPVEEIEAKSEPPPAEPAPQEEPPQIQEAPPVIESSPPPSTPEATAPPEPAAPPAPTVTPSPPEPIPTEPSPPRAPWMRGFQVPPPRLFGASAPAGETAPAAAPVEPPAPSPSTPEARRTADFLATQTGIFAAAAFVEGAVFASTDFPRKPDLDALREFMGSFIDHARGSAQRLGWNRVLTMPCEQFHLTAVVRDTHFIVALHHDRILATITYDALIAAADDLGKSSAD